eukprot:GHVS01014888.1.p1 GENE.GHVS01014888.1~~GHVS01014888.1.p1  ORF type:complete len:190 (+),score=64.92 GHVS01014888.1:81-650(+)
MRYKMSAKKQLENKPPPPLCSSSSSSSSSSSPSSSSCCVTTRVCRRPAVRSCALSHDVLIRGRRNNAGCRKLVIYHKRVMELLQTVGKARVRAAGAAVTTAVWVWQDIMNEYYGDEREKNKGGNNRSSSLLSTHVETCTVEVIDDFVETAADQQDGNIVGEAEEEQNEMWKLYSKTRNVSGIIITMSLS